MEKTISVRLPEELLEKYSNLVKQGEYKDLSKAIRDQLERGKDSDIKTLINIVENIKSMDKLNDLVGFIRFTYNSQELQRSARHSLENQRRLE